MGVACKWARMTASAIPGETLLLRVHIGDVNLMAPATEKGNASYLTND